MAQHFCRVLYSANAWHLFMYFLMLQHFYHQFVCFTGYGFVDFDSPAAAQKAVTALKSTGVQAQMAKVRISQLSCIHLPLVASKFTSHH